MKQRIAALRDARQYRGERLADWLNDADVAPQNTQGLLRQLDKLAALLADIVKRGRHIIRQPLPPEHAERDTGLWCCWARDRRVATRLARANAALDRYGWEVSGWVRLTRDGPPTVPLLPRQPRQRTLFGAALRDVLEDDTLGRTRRCQHCGRWFWAARAHERNCSRQCRARCGVHASKARWNAYHRNRRALQKIQDQLKLATHADDRAKLETQYRVLLQAKEKLQESKGGRRYVKR